MDGFNGGRFSSVDLVSLLDESGFAEHSLPAFWRALEKDQGPRLYTDILFHLTRMEFHPGEAKVHWENILEHRESLSRILAREMGLRTAVCDYFLSLRPMFDNPVVVESLLLVRSERFALMDELTGLHNRRFFNRELTKEMERSRRSGEPFSLLMLDVDHFKAFNDRHGHQAGDKALSAIADILRTTARQVDHVARYGGEEFAVILPQASRSEALTTAERHRAAVERNIFLTPDNTPLRLTVSIGAATYPPDADNEADLISKADHALYRAKRLGRNRVCAETRDMREYARYPLSIPARCILPGNGSPAVFKGRTLNISLSGMLVECERPLAVGEKIRAELANPKNGNELPLDATAVRSSVDLDRENLYYVALAFTPRPDEKSLISFISRHSPSLH